MREIYIVNATEVNISDANPQGVYRVIPGFPKTYDSRDYKATEANPNGDPTIARIVAEAEWGDERKALATADAPKRVKWTVTLDRSDGRNLKCETWGYFPDMTPTPEEAAEE